MAMPTGTAELAIANPEMEGIIVHLCIDTIFELRNWGFWAKS